MTTKHMTPITKALQGDLLDTLTSVSEYLDRYVDVMDGDDGEPRPNSAMSLKAEVDRAYERLERDIKAQTIATSRTEEEKLERILKVIRGKMNPVWENPSAGLADIIVQGEGWMRGVALGILYALEERP